MNEVINIFSTPIYIKKLNLNLDTLKLYIENLERQNNKRVISNEGGFQSNDLDNNQEEVQELIEELNKNVEIFKKVFNIENTKLDNLWANINYFGNYNILHCHINSLISGVFYVQTKKDSGAIEFVNDFETIEYHLQKIKLKDYNIYNSSKYFVVPEDNLLILFPSWLKHRVKPNLTKDKRMSFSFNYN